MTKWARRNGKRVKASKSLDRKLDYRCPYSNCSNKLILNLCKEKIDYFSHSRGSECVGNPEEECDSHLAMKLTIQQLLNIPDDDIESDYLDTYPDLIWRYNGLIYAIEVQHSLLSIDKWLERTDKYLKKDILPIWILHQNEDFVPTEEKDSVAYFVKNKGKFGLIDERNDYYRFKDIEIALNEIYG